MGDARRRGGRTLRVLGGRFLLRDFCFRGGGLGYCFACGLGRLIRRFACLGQHLGYGNPIIGADFFASHGRRPKAGPSSRVFANLFCRVRAELDAGQPDMDFHHDLPGEKDRAWQGFRDGQQVNSNSFVRQ